MQTLCPDLLHGSTEKRAAAGQPAAQRIFLLRHGQIPESSPRRYIGQQDLPLSPEGIRQMERTAEFLARQNIAGLFASPLKRCREGAEIAAGKLNLEPVLLAEFREINLGLWEGLQREEIKKKFPGAWEARGRDPARYRPPQGESFQDLSERVVPAFLQLTGNFRGDIAVFSHAGVNKVILSSLFRLPLARIFALPQGYGCINLLERREGKFSLALLNYQP